MLLSLTLLFVSVTLVTVVAVHFLAQTRVFRKYQSIFSNVMIGIGVLIPLIFIFFLQSTFGSIVDKVRDIPFLLYPLHIFYKIAVEPFSIEAILGLLAWIGLTLFLLYLTKRRSFLVFMTWSCLIVRRRSKKNVAARREFQPLKRDFSAWFYATTSPSWDRGLAWLQCFYKCFPSLSHDDRSDFQNPRFSDSSRHSSSILVTLFL